jgi:uncharacterized membrane protein HdeD (DUF308 family)
MKKEYKFWQSIGFWIHNGAQIAVLAFAGFDKLPPNISAILMSIIAGAYIMARGIGKIGLQYDSSKKNFWQTSEFYIMSLGALMAIISGLEGIIKPETSTSIMTALAALYQISTRMSGIGDPNADIVKDLIDRKEDGKTFKEDLKETLEKEAKN